MLQQPHMCVPIWLCAGLGQWNHFARDSLNIISCPPHLPPFLSGNTFPPGWTLKDLSSQFKSSASSLHAVPCPYTVQWHHSLFPWDAFVTNKGTHAMLLTDNYNASRKISETVYRFTILKWFPFPNLIFYFFMGWLWSEVFGFSLIDWSTMKPHVYDYKTG